MASEENRLIHKAQKGEKEAFQALIEKYYSYVRKMLAGMSGNEADADDLTQETFLKMIRSIERFDPSGKASFATWLITIAKRTFIDYIRRLKPEAVGYGLEEMAALESAEDSFIKNEAIEGAMKAIGELPKGQALLIKMRYFERMTLSEIAEKTGTEPKTAKSRVHSAIKNLRKKMREDDGK